MRHRAPAPQSVETKPVADGYQLCARCGQVLAAGDSAVVVPRAPFWFIYTHPEGPGCPSKAVRGWLAVRKTEGVRQSPNVPTPRPAAPVRIGGFVFPCTCLLDDKHIEVELGLVTYHASDEGSPGPDDIRVLLARRFLRSVGGGKWTSAAAEGSGSGWRPVVRNSVEDDLVSVIDAGVLDAVLQALDDTLHRERELTYATGRAAPDDGPHVFIGEIGKDAKQIQVRQRRKTRLPKAPFGARRERAGRPKPEPAQMPYNSREKPELYTWHEPPRANRIRHWPRNVPHAAHGPVAVLRPEAVAELNAVRNAQFRTENILRRETEMARLSLEQYFALPGTPMENSPVGKLIVRILAKSPGMSAEDARVEARELLNRTAGRRRYVLPRVLTAEQQAVTAAAGREYWASRGRLQTAA